MEKEGHCIILDLHPFRLIDWIQENDMPRFLCLSLFLSANMLPHLKEIQLAGFVEVGLKGVDWWERGGSKKFLKCTHALDGTKN